MARRPDWHDDYWLLVMQAYLHRPVGIKPMYSRIMVDLSMELHIPPQTLRNRMQQLARLDTPRIERIWNTYSSDRKRLTRAVQLLRDMKGFGAAEDFYEGVEVQESFERDFRPLDEDERFTPVMLILILNLYFQLCHVYHHLLSEGIGMRHLLDYYFLLKSGGPISEQQRKNMVQQLKYFGLHRVAQSMMWVLKHVLGLADEYLIAMPSEKLGHILLHEMLEGGNLGKHDERLLSGVQPKGWKHNVQRLVRDVRMVWYFPSECLWEPAFRVYHWFWRLAHQYHH